MTPKLGVCYYPEHWPQHLWETDAKEMAELGLSLVRIGEFAWSRIEPEPGQYQFEWLDKAIEILGGAGLQIILGTPSATPPRWMVDKFPDMLAVDRDGNPRKFGSRRHYCFSHDGYREASADMCERLAKRYAKNPHIWAWQIDNEYGCHDTILSYSESARRAFQGWLEKKYGDIQALNAAWGNVFWSMEYSKFTDVDLPNLTVTEPNPSHRMDFRRFSSDQVTNFNFHQCQAIRQYSDLPLIHNYMGRITDFDHFEVGRDLDIASWDSYPLGFLEDRSDKPNSFRHDFQRQGDPDFQAFHHDLYRAVGKSRWGIMEQQPGPVNWAPYNPAPLPGMVRLWSWEAIAHGAEFVCYFRWRQAPFAQEQMHSAIKRPDNKPTTAHQEIQQLARELTELSPIKPAKSAIIFDYESAWAWEVQPQGQDFDYFRLVYEFYVALRKLGLDIDILPATIDTLSGYEHVFIPGLFSLGDNLTKAISSSDAQIILGPRTDSKTHDFQIQNDPLKSIGLNISMGSVESLRPTETIKISEGGQFKIWREMIETDHDVIAKTACDYPAILSKDNLIYLCGWPDESSLSHILKHKCGIDNKPLPEGLRCRSIGAHKLDLNYNNHAVDCNGVKIPAAGIRLQNIKTKTYDIED